MQTQLKRLDRIIALLATARNDIAQAPEVELDVDGLLNVVEVATETFIEEVNEELK